MPHKGKVHDTQESVHSLHNGGRKTWTWTEKVTQTEVQWSSNCLSCRTCQTFTPLVRLWGSNCKTKPTFSLHCSYTETTLPIHSTSVWERTPSSSRNQNTPFRATQKLLSPPHVNNEYYPRPISFIHSRHLQHANGYLSMQRVMHK